MNLGLSNNKCAGACCRLGVAWVCWLGGLGCYAQVVTELIPVDGVWRYEDSQTDLGVAWREVAYDDSGWASGPGALGFPGSEALPLGTIQTVLERDPTATFTFYFRRHLTIDADPTGWTLVFSNVVDDGAVFYLNGEEVGRVAMAAGEVTFFTQATRAIDVVATGVETLEVPGTALVEGDNVLAVEVHQGGTSSSDLVFASAIYVREPYEGPVRVTQELVNIEALVGDTVKLELGVAGTPPFEFRWFKDGEEIAGATNAVLLLTPATVQDAGMYSVMVSNALGGVSSGPVSVSLSGVRLLHWNHPWRYDPSGVDLGEAWRDPEFDDDGWAVGPGVLGFPESEVLPEPVGSVETVVPRTNGVFTYYFRTEFNLPAEPADFALDFQVLIDDGAVFYLNGREIQRLGIDGVPTVSLPASRSVGNATFETFATSWREMRAGMNVLAVEVHQVSALNSDMIFGLELVARPLELVEIRIVRQPESVVVGELGEIVMSVEYEGTRERLQWFRNGQAIEGATRPTYAIPTLALEDAGIYQVVISNSINMVTSEVAELTVIPDELAPVVSMADGRRDLEMIRVTFDEAVDESSATDEAHYMVTNLWGGTLAVWGVEREDGTNVMLLTEPRETGVNYLLVVGGVGDLARASNTVEPGTFVPVISQLRPVEFGSTWRFYDPFPLIDELDLGTEWLQADYDLSGWGIGDGVFGFGVLPLPEGLTQGTRLSSGVVTTYFRRGLDPMLDFVSPLGAELWMRHLRSDGLIVYLAGAEVYRFNLPGGAVTYETLAQLVTSSAPISDRIELPWSEAVGGGSLAAELHGTSEFDWGKAFGIELRADVTSYAAGPVLITENPSDRVVEELDSVEFEFGVLAANRFQWHRNGEPIPGATEPRYRIEVTRADLDGSLYSVVAGNATHSATSGVARLSVNADTTPPRVVSVDAEGTGIVVLFNKPMADSVLSPEHFDVASRTGESGMVVGVERLDPFRVRLTTAAPARIGDWVMIEGVKDASLAGNPLEGTARWFVGFPGGIVPIDAIWNYDASGTDLGEAWKEPGYDDSAWLRGPALLGAEIAALPEPIRTPVPLGPITTYFRTSFASEVAESASVFRLRTILDDGGVFYLNGQEFFRARVVPGQTYSTTSPSVGDAIYEGPFEVALPSLATGENVLAVEVHQQSSTSSDMVFGMELTTDPVVSRELMVPPAPELHIVLDGMTAVLAWDAEGFVLESSLLIDGPWISLSATEQSPVFARISSGSASYFRLRRVVWELGERGRFECGGIR